MKKQLLLFVMILLPMVANAADVVIDGIYYNLSKNDKVAVVTHRDNNYNSYSGDVVIPSSFTYGGTEYRVSKIGGCAFRDCGNLTTVIIPETVTIIDSGAFQNCTGLTSVTIPNSVISIWNDAFEKCSGLISVTIPNSVTYLGQNAFRFCSSMSSLTIGDNISDIGEGAFQYCYSLTTVSIPNTVAIIREKAFEWCSSLVSVTIGSGVKSIADKAFANCPELANIYCFAKEVPHSPYGSNSDMFKKSKIEEATLYVPSSLIEQYKARNPWYGFGTIASLDCIDGIYYNFNNDEAEVTYLDESYNSYSGEVVIPTSVTSVWGKTYSVTGIGEYTFKGCSNLTAVTIPNSVKKIGAAAFDGCKELSSISLPEYLSNIGNVAFRDCSSLSSVTIPSSVTTINVGTFYRCASLTSITIPSSVKDISNFAFQDCKSLADVYCLSESVPKTNSTAFDNTPIKSATLHIPNRSIHLYKASIPWNTFGSYAGLHGRAYTLSYEINDTEYKSYNVWEDEKIIPEEKPIKEGYTFGGWSDIPEWMPAHDVTVTGFFSINSYTLTYIVDGEEYKCYQINYGTNIAAEVVPTKVGYTFSGWSEVPETMPAHDITVTGSFSVNSYTLTYMVDDGLYKTYEVEYGTTIIPEEEPQKTGYTFSGWSEIPSMMPAKDVVISGTFTINNYKLTYVVDGVEYKTVEVEYNSVIMLETEPTKEGHTFSGWSEIPETMPANDVIITGSFTVNTYTLIYIVDGEVYKTCQVDYGTTITPEASPSKTGYTFSGWYEVPSTMPAMDVTVSGTFAINSYILAYLVDGEVYKTYEIIYETAIMPEAEPMKEGYTFSGWSEIPETMPAYDVTVTGSFIVNKYRVTYIIDGEIFATDYVEYGAAIVPPSVEEKEGATFSGWADVPEIMPAHDLTIYGSFTSGIAEVLMATQRNVRIYSQDGKKKGKLQKGLNIVILDDGTVKKVIVK